MIQGKVYVTKSLIDDLADAIDTRGGTTGGGTLAQLKTKVQNIPGGGGSPYSWDDDVVFMDYDGTIIVTYTAAEFAQLTELPANPTHEGLTADGWNWTLSEAKTYVAECGSLVIGQNYHTTDGKTKLYMHLNSHTLTLKLTFSCNDGNTEVVVDWGDNSAAETVSVARSGTTVSHAYSAAGDYTITIDVTGTYNVCLGYRANTVFIASDSTADPLTGFFNKEVVQRVEIGDKVSGLTFGSLWASCEYISLSSTCELYGGNFFGAPALVIPRAVTSLAQNMFNFSPYLHYVSIPPTVTRIYGGAFSYTGIYRLHTPIGLASLGSVTQYSDVKKMTIGTFNDGTYGKKLTSSFAYNCYNLEEIKLPSDVTEIPSSGFYWCQALREFVVPATVTKIDTYSFANCKNLRRLVMLSSTPPTLSGTSAFNSDTLFRIEVPYSADHSVLNAYKTATNWSTYASRMVESEAS